MAAGPYRADVGQQVEDDARRRYAWLESLQDASRAVRPARRHEPSRVRSDAVLHDGRRPHRGSGLLRGHGAPAQSSVPDEKKNAGMSLDCRALERSNVSTLSL